MQAEKSAPAPDAAGQGLAVVIEAEAIAHNLKILQSKMRAPIMAVVKNNGYGIGMVEYAAFLAQQGISRFGVKDGEEALALRAAGIDGNIYLLAPVTDVPQLVRLIRTEAILCIDSAATALQVKRAGYLAGRTPEVQIAVDTGLGRYGFLPGQLEQAAVAAELFRVRGVYTHFAEPYSDSGFTKRQYTRFLAFVEKLRQKGIEVGELHCCATGGALRFSNMHMDMVRLGSGILGRTPDAGKLGLKKVGRIAVQIAAVKELPAGWNVGYGRHARLKRRVKIGVLQAGAQAGLFLGRQETDVGSMRYLARAARAVFERKRLTVCLREHRLPVLGMVGINHVAVDLSGISCREGEFVYAECNPAFCPAQILRVWRQ